MLRHWRNRRETDLRTKTGKDRFIRRWLAERMGHSWTKRAGGTFAEGNRCTFCGRKYGTAAGVFCPKRKKKPNRWKVHSSRALQAAQYPREIPKRDAGWILAELHRIEEQLASAERRGFYYYKHQGRDYYSIPLDDRFWKYARPCRRYRTLLAQWWALPYAETSTALGDYQSPNVPAQRSSVNWTAQRNNLIKRAKQKGQLHFFEGQTEYKLLPTAVLL